nr:hypothetical protein [uncultured Campylobacter sp.]
MYDIVVFELKALAQANSNELVNLSKEDINAINQALIILQKTTTIRLQSKRFHTLFA